MTSHQRKNISTIATMTQVRPAPPPHTRSPAACVQIEICRSRVRGPDQLRVFWMRATIKLKIGSQKPEFAPLITSSSPHSTRTRARTQRLLSAHGGHVAPVFTKPVSVQEKAQRNKGRGEAARGRQANPASLFCGRRFIPRHEADLVSYRCNDQRLRMIRSVAGGSKLIRRSSVRLSAASSWIGSNGGKSEVRRQHLQNKMQLMGRGGALA